MVPREFGHYLLEALLGTGGMGEVYRAHDSRHERDVAIKLLPEVLAGDQEYTRRFRRESRVAARLREPHVIPIHDFGEIDGRLFIDMRLVDGSDLGKVLDDGPLAVHRAVHLISQVADALDAAHDDGLVHRDVKPTNVLLTPTDFVYVVDFGIARSIGTAGTALTMTGAAIGTLDYMAPERFTMGEIDRRTDVYSLTCLLHECLTAKRPFKGRDLPSLMYAHLSTEPPRASDLVDGVPQAMDEVIARGMAKKPEDRFPTAGALAAAAREVALNTVGATTDAGATMHMRHMPLREERAPVREQRQPVREEHPPVRDARPPVHEDRTEVVVPGAVAPPIAARSDASPNGEWRPPEEPPPGGAGGDRVGGPQGEPAARPNGKRHTSRAMVAAVAVLAVALAALAVILVRSGAFSALGQWGSNTAAPTDQQSNQPGPPATTAPPVPSIAVPTVGEAIPVGPTPGYMHMAPNGRFAYTAHRLAGVLTVLDTTINKVTATIPIPQGPPRFVSFSPKGDRAYVSVYTEDLSVNLIVTVDTATNTVIGQAPVGRKPYASATTPDGRLLYVPSHDDGRLDVIDTATTTLVKEIPVPRNPHWVAFSLDGRFIYTANHESGVVTVLDSTTDTIIKEIPVGVSPHSIAVSPDGSRIAVVNYDSHEVSVIDTATNEVAATVAVGLRPQDIAYAPDGRFFYTTNVDADTVSVISTATNTITATIAIGDGPTSITVLPNGQRAYVTLLNEGTVRILDIAAV